MPSTAKAKEEAKSTAEGKRHTLEIWKVIWLLDIVRAPTIERNRLQYGRLLMTTLLDDTTQL